MVAAGQRIAATAITSAAQRAVLAAMKNHVQAANNVVETNRRQAADLAAGVRNIDYKQGPPGPRPRRIRSRYAVLLPAGPSRRGGAAGQSDRLDAFYPIVCDCYHHGRHGDVVPGVQDLRKQGLLNDADRFSANKG